MLLVVSGLPGTGKTAVARSVAERTGAVHLSVDAVADAMLGVGSEPGWTTGVAAYEAVRAAAELNLSLGRAVVVDAVNDSEAARDTWRNAARATATTVTFVLLTLSDEAEHRRRLQDRERGLLHVDEPTWDDVRGRAKAFEPWTGPCHVVDAGAALDEVVARVLDDIDA